MIKPTALWNFIHECELADAEYIGRICLALAKKPNIPFSRAEKIQFLSIAKDSCDMDERINERKRRDRERKRQFNLRKNAENAESAGMDDKTIPQEERGRTRKNAEEQDSVSPYIHPSIHSSIHPSKTKYTEPIPIPITRAKSESASESAEISKLRMDMWQWPDDDIRYGKAGTARMGTAAMLSCLLGKGGWAKAVAQAGEDAVLELFLTFRAEIRVGEAVDNPGAAFTKRLERDLGVDFSISLAESTKVGKAKATC